MPPVAPVCLIQLTVCSSDWLSYGIWRCLTSLFEIFPLASLIPLSLAMLLFHSRSFPGIFTGFSFNSSPASTAAHHKSLKHCLSMGSIQGDSPSYQSILSPWVISTTSLILSTTYTVMIIANVFLWYQPHSWTVVYIQLLTKHSPHKPHRHLKYEMSETSKLIISEPYSFPSPLVLHCPPLSSFLLNYIISQVRLKFSPI